MVQLRYANYPKDYFMGMLPSSQYGSVAVLPPIAPSVVSSRVLAFEDSLKPSTSSPINNPSKGTTVVSASSSASFRRLFVNSDLSALSIRATEYLQRWKEVVQFNSKDYSDQMAAQFGIKAPEYMGTMLIILAVGPVLSTSMR